MRALGTLPKSLCAQAMLSKLPCLHLQGLWKLLWRGDSPFVEKFYAARKFTEINIGQWAVVSGKRQRQVSYIVSCCAGCAFQAPL